jgi:uncharacterized protein (TIGR02246 family)
MTDIAALEARLAKLEARQAISELVTKYAVACDEHDLPALSHLFCQDATFESPSGIMHAQGRDAITDMFVQLLRVRGPAYHWTHDLIVRFDENDRTRASGVVHSHAETTPEGVVSVSAMKYDDEYRFIAGEWLFAKRVIKFLYYVPVEQYMQRLNLEKRVRMGSQWLAADYPESLASWQQFERLYGSREESDG